MKKLYLLPIIFSLNACMFFPQNNDSIVPAGTPLNKVVTLVQKDQIIRIQALNKRIIRTTLIIDGEEVKRSYFSKSEVVRRYPVPKTVNVQCSERTENMTHYKVETNIHPVSEKLEEGKTYIFMCQGLDSYKVTPYNVKDIMQ